MSENLEGLWLFEFEDGQSIRFAVHEAVEGRDQCVELVEVRALSFRYTAQLLSKTMQVNHGRATEKRKYAYFVLFSDQTPRWRSYSRTEDSRVNSGLTSTGFTGVAGLNVSSLGIRSKLERVMCSHGPFLGGLRRTCNGFIHG